MQKRHSAPSTYVQRTLLPGRADATARIAPAFADLRGMAFDSFSRRSYVEAPHPPVANRGSDPTNGGLGWCVKREHLGKAALETAREQLRIGDRRRIDIRTDTACIAMGIERDHRRAARQGTETVDALDPCAGEIELVTQSRHVARLEIVRFGHAAGDGAQQRGGKACQPRGEERET